MLRIQGRKAFSKKLILFEGFRSWEYQNRIQHDMLYRLVGSNLEKVQSLTFTRFLVTLAMEGRVKLVVEFL